MKIIPLTQGQRALVDDEDYEWLSQWRWWTFNSRGHLYAGRKLPMSSKCKPRTLLMHREILRLPKSVQLDHINHNGLDNRKCNLRICNYAENQYNQKKRGGTSEYKGVFWHKKDKRWYAQIHPDYTGIHLGSFQEEVDAAKAYDAKAIELYGEFAYLNFPRR